MANRRTARFLGESESRVKATRLVPLAILVFGLSIVISPEITSVRSESRLVDAVQTPIAAAPTSTPQTAGTQKITAEILPKQIDLPPGGEASQVHVVVHNGAAEKIAGAELVWNDDPNLDIRRDPQQPQSIDSNSDFEWNVSISSKSGDAVPPEILFIVKYRQGTGQKLRLTSASLPIRMRDVDQLADVTVQTTLDSLDEQHPNYVYLVISNKSNRLIKLKNITAGGPDFIRFSSEFQEIQAMNDEIDSTIKDFQNRGVKITRDDLSSIVTDARNRIIGENKAEIDRKLASATQSAYGPTGTLDEIKDAITEGVASDHADQIKVAAGNELQEKYKDLIKPAADLGKLKAVVRDLVYLPVKESIAKEHWIFPPHQVGYVPIKVDAKNKVQPGKHLLVFDITFEWGRDETVQTRDMVVYHNVDVQVLGQSTVLQLLAVPSILVLPGFLAVATWGMLATIGLLKPGERFSKLLDFAKSPATPAFWILAISLSIIAYALMRFINHDILRTYGLADLVGLWCIGILGLGVIPYVILARIFSSSNVDSLSVNRTPEEQAIGD